MVSKTKSSIHLFLLLSTIFIATHVFNLDSKEILHQYQHLDLESIPTWVIITLTILVLLTIIHFQTQPRPVYLVNYSCHKPENACKCTKQHFINCSIDGGKFTQESIDFQQKVIDKSGLGEDTYLPEVLLRVPATPSLASARKEAESLMFGAVDQLFTKTSINPKDIAILIVNCSMLNPTPSLSAMIVNHYKLRSNIKSYNIAGMGCSAGVISIDLTKDLLQVYNNSYAMVVSVESATMNWYNGNEKSMLVSNCLFRMGSSAMLLSNKASDKSRSKYELVHTVRTHKGADDKSFTSVTQKEDADGIIGICLSKELMNVAGDALKSNITALGPLVLPLSEKVYFLASLIKKKLFMSRKVKPYVPDFKLAFEHFCVHSGGKAVLDGVEKSLVLSEWHMEPSRMTLYRFGNTSSTSIWYELAYTEAKGRVKKGDRIWQISFGSGFKCNSAVWRALRTINPAKEKNPWMDEIQSFPMDVPRENSA